MNVNRYQRSAALAAAALVLPVALAACAGSTSNDTSSGPSASSASPSDTGAAGTGEPFGPACADLPQSGTGSIEGMAQDPVATAASHNPELSQLTAAIQRAGLTDTLNNTRNITVFAPSNDAFDKVPQDQLDRLLASRSQLRRVLTYHVVPQTVTPQQLSRGSFTTLEGATLTTSGSGTTFRVNDTARIVCGNVKTTNATVYIVDSVLMPPAGATASPTGSPTGSPTETAPESPAESPTGSAPASESPQSPGQ